MCNLLVQANGAPPSFSVPNQSILEGLRPVWITLVSAVQSKVGSSTPPRPCPRAAVAFVFESDGCSIIIPSPCTVRCSPRLQLARAPCWSGKSQIGAHLLRRFVLSILARACPGLPLSLSRTSHFVTTATYSTDTSGSFFEVGGLVSTYRLELGGPTEPAGHARPLITTGNHMGRTDLHADKFVFLEIRLRTSLVRCRGTSASSPPLL
jgi:hypothetical protein